MLEYLSLGWLIIIIIFMTYLVIYIHDIPYEIAKKRNHPHQDAIHAAGWVSLFMLHTIWPLLWIWAYLYTPGKGFMPSKGEDKQSAKEQEQDKKIVQLQEQINSMNTMLQEFKSANVQVQNEEKQNG